LGTESESARLQAQQEQQQAATMVKNKLQASTRAAREEMFHGMEDNLGLGGLAGSLMGLAASLSSPRGRAFMGVMLLVFVLLVTEMELGIFVQVRVACVRVRASGRTAAPASAGETPLKCR
jgi:hypothetical protein